MTDITFSAASIQKAPQTAVTSVATAYPWAAEIEKTIIQSLVTTFGLDFLLFQDKIGGDVDTVHNVRRGIFSSDIEEKRYKEREEYSDVKSNEATTTRCPGRCLRTHASRSRTPSERPAGPRHS